MDASYTDISIISLVIYSLKYVNDFKYIEVV
jgi:hypothetical protein